DRIDAHAQRRKRVHQLARVGHHQFLAAAALAEREEFRVNFSDRHAIVAVGVADRGEQIANFGDGAQPSLDLRDYLIGMRERVSGLRADVNREFARVVGGQEGRADQFAQERDRDDQRDRRDDQRPSMVERPAQRQRVVVLDPAENFPVLRAVMFRADRALGFQIARTQHRGQRKRNQQRHHDRERHRQAERIQESAHHAVDERDGYEDDHERQRSRTDGQPDLGGGRFRGGDRVHVLFFDEAEDIFEHDDGVVDYYSDRERQREQSHAVERETHPQDQ